MCINGSYFYMNVDSKLVHIVDESTFSVNLSIIESEFGYETVLIRKTLLITDLLTD